MTVPPRRPPRQAGADIAIVLIATSASFLVGYIVSSTHNNIDKKADGIFDREGASVVLIDDDRQRVIGWE